MKRTHKLEGPWGRSEGPEPPTASGITPLWQCMADSLNLPQMPLRVPSTLMRPEMPPTLPEEIWSLLPGAEDQRGEAWPSDTEAAKLDSDGQSREGCRWLPQWVARGAWPGTEAGTPTVGCRSQGPRRWGPPGSALRRPLAQTSRPSRLSPHYTGDTNGPRTPSAWQGPALRLGGDSEVDPMAPRRQGPSPPP